MQSVDMQVLTRVRDWLVAGQPCWLCTVVETFGSSPRPVGSLLTCNSAGEVTGSLSGGCVEDDLLEQLQANTLPRDQAQLLKYGLTPEDTERMGLPCGGHLHVLAEPLEPDTATRDHFASLVASLEARRCTRRQVQLPSGAMALFPEQHREPLRLEQHQDANTVLQHTLGPGWQLFLVGAGMVASYLAEMALALDYQVTLCDTREHLLEQWAVPGVRLIRDMPDDAVREHANDPHTAIVTLSHDPRIDDMALMEALTSNAFYIGAMGSSRTSAARRERLAALDLTPMQIARLHAPLGLPIGSKTPPEIAISAIAEITAVRKQQHQQALDHLAAGENAAHGATSEITSISASA